MEDLGLRIYQLGAIISAILWFIALEIDYKENEVKPDFIDYLSVLIMGLFSWATVLWFIVGKIKEKRNNG